MKKFIAGFGLTAVLALAVAATTIIYHEEAQAASTPAAQSTTFAREWDSTVAAGAIITSPVFDLYNVTECLAAADNSAGGSTRNVLVDYIAKDGATILYRQTVAITTGLRVLVGIGSVSQTASLPTGVTVIPVATGRRMQFTLSAAGAAAGSLAVYCR